jgi:cytochrome c5
VRTIRLMLGLVLAAAAATVAVAQENAGGTEIVNPFRGVMQDRSAHADDEALYVEKCSMCHRRMGMGTVLLGRRVPADQAELEKREALTVPYITLAARQGIGNMPRISRAEVSDEQLARIAQYLVQAGAQ